MAKASVKQNYIRVVEPWGGGHTPWDTGLGNRLLHWDVLYHVNRQNDYKFFLEVEERYWRELEFIDLPGVRPFRLNAGLDEEIQKLVSKFDFDLSSQTIIRNAVLDDSLLEEFLNDKNHKLPNQNYYTSFDWKHIATIYDRNEPSGLSRITIKNKDLFNVIRKMGSYCVGIHLRRGAGVYKSPKDLLELPRSVQNNPKLQTLHQTTIYKYWKNNVYERLIKEMLQINPTQKFFISCDLQMGEYEFLKQTFGNTVYTREDVIKELPASIIEGIDFENPKDVRKIAIESVIDMMTLSYCDFIVGAPHSSWLNALLRIRPIPHSFIFEPRDRVIKSYVNALETSRGVL